MGKKKAEASLRAHVWIKSGEKKFGLVTQHKVDNAIANIRKGKDGGYEFPRDDNPSDELVLALYDKHGGRIIDSAGSKVKTFTFWNIKEAKPFKVK